MSLLALLVLNLQADDTPPVALFVGSACLPFDSSPQTAAALPRDAALWLPLVIRPAVVCVFAEALSGWYLPPGIGVLEWSEHAFPMVAKLTQVTSIVCLLVDACW